MKKGGKVLTTHSKRYLILLGITLTFFVIFAFNIPNFVHLMTITNILRQATVLTIVAIGMTMVILTGGIDLSVGANIAVSSAVAALVMNSVGAESAFGACIGIAVTLLTALLVGALNGFLIGYLGISAFITTLATQSLCRGVALLLTNSNRILVTNPYYNLLGSHGFQVGPMTVPSLVFILIPLVVLSLWYMRHFRMGRRIYAVGGNPDAANASGIMVPHHKMMIYLMCGLMCGIGAIIIVGRAGSAQSQAGIGLEFEVITAVVMGGTSLLGGLGTLTGTYLGSLLMGVITFGINMLSIPIYSNYIIKGVFVLIAVLSDQFVPLVKSLRKAVSSKGKRHDSIKDVATKTCLGAQHVLQLEHIKKEFSGVKALKDVSLEIKSGQVHALLGENGAGKSTLIKILSGVHTKDGGGITLDGKLVDIRNTRDSANLGISVIYQEFALMPELSIAQNIFLGKELRKGVVLSRGEMTRRAKEILAKLRLDIDVNRKVRSLSVSQQQMVEIAKAMGADSWLVVMDEPTSAISEAEKDKLFDQIREMKKLGLAVVYISHRMSEIFEIADTVTVLRDGEQIVSKPVKEVNEDSLIRYMVGRDIGDVFSRERTKRGDVVLRVENLGRKGYFEPISFEVRAGEVLGFSGLVGAGRTEIARCLFGMDRPDTGEIYLGGQRISIRSTKKALEQGICYVSEDRRREGIIPLRSVQENIVIAALDHITKGSVVNDSEQKRISSYYIEKFKIKTPSDLQAIGLLSGGNQQKCCLAKMLATNPKLIILDEPTRGIDVGAKAEIHKLIEELAKQDMAIILISSELPEIIGACDRIMVLAEGQFKGEFDDKSVTQEAIMALATEG